MAKKINCTLALTAKVSPCLWVVPAASGIQLIEVALHDYFSS